MNRIYKKEIFVKPGEKKENDRMTLTASEAIKTIRGAKVDGIAHSHDEILYIVVDAIVNGERKAYRIKAERDTVVPLIVEEISETVLSEGEHAEKRHPDRLATDEVRSMAWEVYRREATVLSKRRKT
jgi:hypothetical protein